MSVTNTDSSVKLPSLAKLKKNKSREVNSGLRSKSLSNLSEMSGSNRSFNVSGVEKKMGDSLKQKLDANQLRDRISKVVY